MNRRTLAILASVGALLVGAVAVACGSGGGSNGFWNDQEGGGGGGADADLGDVPGFGPVNDTGPACTGLECNVAKCPGGQTTSISGTVYDPGGTTPLYNVAVYVPNAPLSPIPDGVDIAKCEACAAPLSGNPIASTLTDAQGHFKLEGVPAGADIPIVLQTGKFRREGVTVPQVTGCQDNPVADPGHTRLRLPKNKSEGHLPLVAITTGGCEGLECVVRTYGFDDGEFTGASGSGRFHLYTGSMGGAATGSTDAYVFWGSQDIFKYDMILNSCECQPHPRDASGPAYTNMLQYLNHGGRLFTSDYQYNWFTDAQAPAVFKTTANWITNQAAPRLGPPYFVDTSFPKGQALNDWLQFVFKGSSPPPNGQISLSTLLFNVDEVKPGATRWIYSSESGQPVTSPTATGQTVKYLSFNTPFSTDPDAGASQCGRAVFADIHVSHNIHTTTWPAGCSALTKDQQVTAFEFLFFDMASCVQNDTAPPAPPPVK